MNSRENIPPSIGETTRALRVLNGKPLKFTVRVHRADGSVIEFQADSRPKLNFNTEARALFLYSGDYEAAPILAWESGMIVLCDDNEKEGK